MLVTTVGSLVALLSAFGIGYRLHLRYFGTAETSSLEQNQEGLIVSAVLLLLGLLLGFTFSLSLDRFEQRRMLVVTEANAIGTSYLRAQLLDEPDRSRLSNLLTVYTDNRIQLATSRTRQDRQKLLTRNDQLLSQIWAAVSAALDTAKGKAVSTPLLFSFNELIDLDSERKLARITGVPGLVLLLLYLFLFVTAAVVGFVLSGTRQRVMALIMLVLLAFTISIIADLNSPSSGTIVESQQPMVMVKKLLAEPRSGFDQYKQRASP